ncbi:MAG TPA: SUMF1/EgtB/PvdO family nonheme iron enzyme [Flavitalea sp.]|nr:SUMF1/EgtB/PvdO family nonheme iron enzyme [Flavitalea sp.]
MTKIFFTLVFLFSALFAHTQETQVLQPFEQTVSGTAIRFNMVPIPAGVFTMGSPEIENGHLPDEAPQRKIAISSFWMQSLEVTHDQFLVFFDDEQFSRNSMVDAVTRPTAQYIDLSWGMGKQGGFPANSMSQHTAMMYCRWLYQKTGIFYRLPTEAEWEYACRAGSTSLYPMGTPDNNINEIAWHANNSDGKYHKTGTKKPNAWGLYDMLGNVSEWTLDQYDANFLSTLSDNNQDPVNKPVSRYPRSVRGGSFEQKPELLRCAKRYYSEPAWNRRDPQVPKSKWWLTDAASVGFRVVKPYKQPTAEEAMVFYEQYSSK